VLRIVRPRGHDQSPSGADRPEKCIDEALWTAFDGTDGAKRSVNLEHAALSDPEVA
jgi:hypothetical protein